jgi:5-methylcytosine-specific restriction endonuclease McrA
MPGDPFYMSEAWRSLRLKALRRYRYSCIVCGTSIRGRGMARIDRVVMRRVNPLRAMDRCSLLDLIKGRPARRLTTDQ